MATLVETFQAIANGLRSMLGQTSTTKYTPAQMASTLSGITNRGAVSQTLNTSTTSYTVPAGYHNGSGKVSITTETKTATPSTSSQSITPSSGKVLSKVTVNAISTQEKTVTSSRSAQTVTPDSGKYLSKVTVNALAPTGTYTATTRSDSIDMGATSNYRYVKTSNVPNKNSDTFTFGTEGESMGNTKDLGETNTIRYVNGNNVFAYGKKVGLWLGKLLLWSSSGSSNYTFTADETTPYLILSNGPVTITNAGEISSTYGPYVSGNSSIYIYWIQGTADTTKIKTTTGTMNYVFKFNHE